MTALTPFTQEERWAARRAFNAKAESLAKAEGIDILAAMMKIILNPANAELVTKMREPRPPRKKHTTLAQSQALFEDLQRKVNELRGAVEKRARMRER